MKEMVYAVEPQSVEELVAHIHAAVALITPEMLANVRNNVLRRIDACLAVDGNVFEQIL